MYYPGVPASGSQGEKPNLAYVPGPSPYVQAQTAYPQTGLPPGMSAPGLTPRFAAAPPQGYAVVSQSGLTGYTTGVPSYPHAYSMPGMSTASPTYISAAGQYPGGVSYPQAALGPRSLPPSAYGGPPLQAGAPLIAGYPAVQGAIPAAQVAAQQSRSYPMGAAPAMTAYPPGYPVPSAAGQAPVPYAATAFSPPY